MNQTLLDLAPQALAPLDRTGFDIGWDHAHHGLVPPPGLLESITSVSQGWSAGKAVYGRRTTKTSRATRSWLELRLRAWWGGVPFDRTQVTPGYLARLDLDHCPVRRVALGGAAGEPDAAVYECLNRPAGCIAGNLIALSHAARQRAGVDSLSARRLARRCEADGGDIDGMDSGAWWRVAALRTFTTPQPFHDVACLPLAVLPRATLKLVNPVQRLQALVTAQFGTPGWSARTRAIAAMLPEHTLRHDFNLFVGALAPRVLEAPKRGLRLALEDAWLTDRVQRRWQHFALSLGEPRCTTLLAQADRCAALRGAEIDR